MTRKQREKSLLKNPFIKFFERPICFSNLLYKFFTGSRTYYANDMIQCNTTSRTVDDCFLLIKYYKISLDYSELAKLISFLRQQKNLNSWICTTIHKRVHVIPFGKRNENLIKTALKKYGIKNYKL